MTCGSCGATIADKAIVCYRCGAPTAAPAARTVKAPARRPAGAGLVLLALGVILLAVSVVLPDDPWIARQAARLAGMAMAVIAVYRLLAGRR